MNTCPICKRANGVERFQTGRDTAGFKCQHCGSFEISNSAFAGWQDRVEQMTVLQRAVLAHKVRVSSEGQSLLIGTSWLDELLRDARLPSPSIQAARLLSIVGDHYSRTGEGYLIDAETISPVIGSFDPSMVNQIRRDLEAKGLLVQLGRGERPNPRGSGVIAGTLFGLSLDGWERYEGERRGDVSSKYGFIAMKFGDPDLNVLLEETIRPKVRASIGYEVVNLLHVSRAGVIDNIMRQQIRDSAFVLADLTHDNYGAYWEAGYAEGLGKPVIYLCQEEKFQAAKTHFDTNHCTTVMWANDKLDHFAIELVATIRRSLNLF
jgi:nucleoside 2-deoxyribosyltransferase